MTEKREFPHHMIREIFEQPRGLHDTIAPRISLPEGIVQLNEVPISRDDLRSLSRINIVASGTSRHAGMVGQFMIQELAAIPVDVDYASEFEYRNPIIGQSELTIVITQSGETADTSAAQREAKAGARGRSPSPMWREPPSPARPMASSTRSPARKSVSLQPRPSPHRWRPCSCSPCTWVRRAARCRKTGGRTTSANCSTFLTNCATC